MNPNEKQEIINIYNDFVLNKKNINNINILKLKIMANNMLDYLSKKYHLTHNEIISTLTEIYKHIDIYDYDGEKLFELIENTCEVISKKRLNN